MEERGRLPGRMKLVGAGGGEKEDRLLDGREKSAISLLYRIPVDTESIPDPQAPLTVDVIPTAFRSLSTTHVCDVPWSSRLWKRGCFLPSTAGRP